MAGSWREALVRRRWWLIALALLILVRVALPEVLRRVIESQASQALNARVNVGDVDLRLWRGGVALEDVAVRDKDAPEAPPPPEKTDPNAPPPPAFDEYSPVIAFKRFAAEVHYLPLFRKTIQLRDITFESPRVALDRLASGDLNVMALVPKQQVVVEAGATPAAVATPTAGPEAAAPAEPWKFGLDKFILSDGRIRFRDLALEGSEPVELGIDRISVDEVALSPAVYGKPGRIHLKLGLDEGVVDVDAQLTLEGAKAIVSTDITANNLPLRRARLYVPNVGWSELKGELDLALTYDLEPEKTNVLHGTVGLRDVSVNVPSLEDVAVGWKSLAVDLERIDLLAQRAAVRKVALDGAVVVVSAEGGLLLPVLTGKGAAAKASAGPSPSATASAVASPGETPPAAVPPAAAEAEKTSPAEPSATPGEPTPQPSAAGEADGSTQTPTPTPTPAASGTAGAPSPPPSASAAPTPPPKPWGWQVGEVTIASSKLRILSNGPHDIGVDLTAKSLSGDDNAIAHATLGLTGEQGATLGVDGDLRIAPVPAFGGTLKIKDLSLPTLPTVQTLLPPEVFPSANLRSDLTILAGLPAGGGEAPADQLRVTGTLGVGALKLSPPQVPGLSLDMQDIELRIDRLNVPGVIPPGHKAGAGAAIDLAAGLKLSAPHVTRTGEGALAVAAQMIVLEVPSLIVPAALAKLAPSDGVPLITGGLGLDLQAPNVSLGNDDTTVQAQTITLKLNDLSLPVQPPAPAPPTPAKGAEVPVAAVEPPVPVLAAPAKLGLKLDVSQLGVATAQKKELNLTTQAIALELNDVVVPGFVAGAPLAPSTDPLQAKATLLLTQPRVMRADGKEFAVSAKSISVPLQSVSLPGVPGGTPPGAALQPLRAVLGEIRIESPAIRATRRKEGIVLPRAAAAPAGAKPTPPPAPTPAAESSPAAKQPLDLQVAALRVTRGGLEFTDHAVEPVFSARFAPIEIDARNIKFPGPQVKPLNIDITSVEQGKITVRGDIGPDTSSLTLKVDQLALAPFNPYATTYSSYSIADGSLSIEMKADAHGGKYDVKNNITLHQFDLAGAEGDSLFEQNFGISLSMALALLRDIQGNIGIAVPLQVDREGNAQVDVMAVVRSALRQAITGAITSPLKMLGAVAGGKGAPVVPAPVAFRLGRAEVTKKGAKSAGRLAEFLVSRPGMGVDLSTAATADDGRWLHEQKLLTDWGNEGAFRRSLAFVTSRGPRQRIRAYLEARAGDKKPELSAEDAAQLDEWLAERPAPTEEELQALGDARLAAVEKVLQAKGIDASRISRGKPPEQPKNAVVGVRLRPAKSAAAESGEEGLPEPGGDTGRSP